MERVPPGCRRLSLAVLRCVFALGAVAAAGVVARADAEPAHLPSDEGNEVAFLIHAGTTDSLATASLLAHLVEGSDMGPVTPAPSELIERAVAADPGRPELVWLEWRDCEPRHCPDEIQIVERLKTLDPSNGLAWLSDLHAAQQQSAAEVTRVIVKMGEGRNPRLYWNQLAAMMFDALTHRDPSRPPTAITRGADDRLLHVVGLLSAVDVPIFPWLAHACQVDQFDVPGRRAACEILMTRLETSDAAITENLSFVVQEGWWPPDSPEYAALQRKHLQQRYLVVASNRARSGRADRDAEVRVAAMRRLAREQDVERTMLAYFHEPLERPASWRIPTGE